MNLRNVLLHKPGVCSPEQSKHFVALLINILLLVGPVDAVPLYEVPVPPAQADHAVPGLGGGEADQTLYLRTVRPEDGDGGEAGGLGQGS